MGERRAGRPTGVGPGLYLVLLLPASALAQTTAPATDAPEPVIDFTVLRGDTLIGLSRTVFVSRSAWREVAALNRLPNADRLQPGKLLRVPLRLLRSQPASATLVSVQGDVRIDNALASAGATLGEGQSLATADSSSAVLELADGTRVKLPPSSLAEVIGSRRYGGRDGGREGGPATAAANPAASAALPNAAGGVFAGMLRLLRGSVEIFATKVLRARPLELTTPTAVIGVRGTQYRVGIGASIGDPAASEQPANSRVEVLEGQVQVDPSAAPASGTRATAPRGIAVPGGFGTRIDAGADPAPAVALLPAPDLSAVPALFERPLVGFSVGDASAAPGHAVRVQVASDTGFDRIVGDYRFAAGAEVRIAGLADGRWFLRVRQLDAQGLEGFDAQRAFTLKLRPEAPAVEPPPAPPASQPDAPRGGLSDDGKRLELRWSGQPGERQQAELAADEGFTRVIARAELNAPAWVLAAPLWPGMYYVRYRTVPPNAEASAWSAALPVDVPFYRRWP